MSVVETLKGIVAGLSYDEAEAIAEACEERMAALGGRAPRRWPKSHKRGFKKDWWAKTVTAVDYGGKNGYAIEGRWLNEKDIADLTEGALVVVSHPFNGNKVYRLCAARAGSTIALMTSRGKVELEGLEALVMSERFGEILDALKTKGVPDVTEDVPI